MTQSQNSLCIGKGQFFTSIDALRRFMLPDEQSNNPMKQYFGHTRAIMLNAVLDKLNADGNLTPKAVCSAVFDTGYAELATWLAGTPVEDMLDGLGFCGESTLASLRQKLYSFYRDVQAAAEAEKAAQAARTAHGWNIFDEVVALHPFDSFIRGQGYGPRQVVGIASMKQLNRVFGNGPRPRLHANKVILRVTPAELNDLYAEAMQADEPNEAEAEVEGQRCTVAVTFTY